MFKKYWALFRQNLINSVQWRAELIVWVLLYIIPTLILMLIWTQILTPGKSLHGFDQSQILTYYWLTLVVRSATGVYFEGWRIREIREGKIDYHLTKPISFFKQVVFVDLGGKFFYLGLSLPAFGLLLLVSQWWFDFQLVNPSLLSLISFLGLLFMGYWLEFLLSYITVLFTFWFTGAEGLQHFKWIMISVFSGAFIPIPFLPTWLKNLAQLLPFKYLYMIPITVIQGTYQLTWLDLAYLSGSLIGLSLITQLIWKYAMYQYTSAGG
ncbi:MAG: hypothetical protein GF390_02430 [Candidatus Pacebacteria bacterium]|nr:hypothetical protein [Candidatus Paceibacterota bacterium]